MPDDLGYTSDDYLVGASVAPPHLRSTIVLVRRLEETHRATLDDWDGARWRTTVDYVVVDILRPGGAQPKDLANLITAKARDAKYGVVDVVRVGAQFSGLGSELATPIWRLRNVLPVMVGDHREISRRKGFWLVPRADVLATLLDVLSRDRIKNDVPDPGGELSRALSTFVPEDRGPDAEDLIRAVALPVWYSETRMRPLTRQPPVPRLPIEPPEPLTFDQWMEWGRRQRPTRTRI